MSPDRVRPALIYTGGTIGCAGVPLVPLPFAEFRARWDRHLGRKFGAPAAWHVLEPPIDSTEATPRDWLRLARLVLEAGAEAPVVLLHGTDTMAWSGAALTQLLTLYGADGTAVGRHPRPVVLTGAQRPLFGDRGVLPGTDAVANLETAFDALPRGGIVIAFGGEVLPADAVMKISSTADRAFEAPRDAAPPPTLPVAEAAALTAQLDLLAPVFGQRRVVTCLAAPAPPEHHAAALSAVIGAAGDALGAIHLMGYGIGNFPAREALAPLLAAARDRGALIVADSQTPMGRVDPRTYGAGNWLVELGAIPAGGHPPGAIDARLHLALALGAAHGWSREVTERFFAGPT